MEAILATDSDGQERLRVAAERKDMWTAKRVEEGAADREAVASRDERPEDAKAVGEQLSREEVEQLEGAEASVRAAVMGK